LRWDGRRHGWGMGALVVLGGKWGRAAGVSDWRGSGVKI